jgi:acetone carboxylase gamma subunit
MIVHDYLEIDEGGKVFRCANCKQVYCKLDQNYKEAVVMEEGTVQELAGRTYASVKPHTYIDDDVVFRIFYCPKCGGIVTTETAKKADPPYNEMEIRL